MTEAEHSSSFPRFLDRRSESAEEWRPGVSTFLLAARRLGAKTLCIFEQHFDPGRSAPQHRHPNHEEAILFLTGRALFIADDVERAVEEGATVIVPADVEHSFVNIGDGVLTTIACFGNSCPTVVYSSAPELIYEIGAGSDSAPHRTLMG